MVEKGTVLIKIAVQSTRDYNMNFSSAFALPDMPWAFRKFLQIITLNNAEFKQQIVKELVLFFKLTYYK